MYEHVGRAAVPTKGTHVIGTVPLTATGVL